MPGFDRTGPAGQGPMTGRGLGDCTGGEYRGGARRFNRRGFGLNSGMGLGYGFRHGFGYRNRWNVSDVSEKTLVENEINVLKDQLSELEKRLSGLNG